MIQIILLLLEFESFLRLYLQKKNDIYRQTFLRRQLIRHKKLTFFDDKNVVVSKMFLAFSGKILVAATK